jgi:exodeoxyribonuclease X
MKIIILDTETTGSAQSDRICQLSFLVCNEELEIETIYNDLCTPPLPISFEAMAIHHITPEMLEGKVNCQESRAYKALCELNHPSNLLVIQNAAFDLGMLEKEGFTSQMQLIDTFRILRAYYPNDGTSSSLQYKRYQWGLYHFEAEQCQQLGITLSAHDALSDVIVLKNLFEKLSNEHSLPKMILACEAPMILEYIPYGKHKGKRFGEIAKVARGDLHYMLKSESLDQDIKASIEHSLDTTKEEAVLTITFGKYAGKTPQEILEMDRNYLYWLHTNAENLHQELKEHIAKLLVSYP